MQIGLSKEEVQVHIQSERHRWNVDSQKLAISPSSAEFAETKIDGYSVKNNGKHALKPSMETSIHRSNIENGVGSVNGTNIAVNGLDEDKRDEHAVLVGNSISAELISNVDQCKCGLFFRWWQ